MTRRPKRAPPATVSDRTKFIGLAVAHGLPNNVIAIAKHTKVSRRLLEMLVHGELASNHPYVPMIAERTGLGENRLRPFLRGKALPDLQVQRLTSRLEGTQGFTLSSKQRSSMKQSRNGNGNHGGAQPGNPGQRFAALERDRERAASNSLVAARVAKNMTAQDLADASNISSATVRNIEAGKVPSNSPTLAEVAKIYGLPLETVAAWQKVRPMSDSALRASLARMASLKSRGGLAAIMARNKTAGRGGVNGASNGASNGTRKHVLRKMELPRREALRTLTNTVNANSMRGVRETTVPTQMLADFLREYFTALGVEGNLVLDPVFERVFD